MFDFVRNNTKIMMGLLFLLIIPSFVMFGLDGYSRFKDQGAVVAHVDGNYDSGYYANYTDSAYDPVTRAVTVKQPKGEKATVVNARVALTDIPTPAGTATISVWSRNLLNEEHLFYKSKDAFGTVSGFFNDPRTFGLELNLKM